MQSVLQKTSKLHQLSGELQKNFDDPKATQTFVCIYTSDVSIGFYSSKRSQPLPFLRPPWFSCLLLQPRAVNDLADKCSALEHEYDGLMHLKTKGDLQGYAGLPAFIQVLEDIYRHVKI